MPNIVAVGTYGGGIGNLLFMHHAGYALAKRLGGAELWMLEEYDARHRPNIAAYKSLFKHVKMASHQEICDPSFERYTEPFFPFHPIKEPTYGKIVINGYFQSYKYFYDYRKEIRDVLWSNERDLYYEAIMKHQALHSDRVTICMHVRRGDYLTLQQYHPTASSDYYKLALEHVLNKLGIPAPGSGSGSVNVSVCGLVKIVVFSDDIEFVKGWDDVLNVARLRNVSIYYEEEANPIKALMLMSLCDHFVIANSSMSLNAYYLRCEAAENAILCAPKTWFGPQGPPFAIYDIVPPSAFVA